MENLRKKSSQVALPLGFLLCEKDGDKKGLTKPCEVEYKEDRVYNCGKPWGKLTFLGKTHHAYRRISIFNRSQKETIYSVQV